jgi:pimeloyl-ACP methyl ester carboxylesterase
VVIVRVDIGGDIRLFVDIEGPQFVPDGPRMVERPVLVLLHGGPGADHSVFKPSFSRIADAAFVVYYDHRGHGRSDDGPVEGWTLENWADDVVRLCDALGIERPVVLGHSWGGLVASFYLARHPDHPSKVVLDSPVGPKNREHQVEAFRELGGDKAATAAEDLFNDPSAEHMARFGEICMPLYNPTPLDRHAFQRTAGRPEMYAHYRRFVEPTLEIPDFAGTRCPTLVFAGRKDPICPIGDVEDWVTTIPDRHRQVERFNNAGHGVWRDEPEAAFTTLRRFVLA